MTMTLVEYFVRHYTLVLDNDSFAYTTRTRAVEEVIIDSGISKVEWNNLSLKDRETTFAQGIGEAVMAIIDEWMDDVLAEKHDTIGERLIREIMITSDSEIEYRLGQHYMPEDSDILEYLEDDEESS